MKTDGIRIECIQHRLPFPESDEFVVVFNSSKQKLDLKGWRLLYEDLSSRKVIHTHYFHELNGSFDPGERLCIISARGIDRFQHQGDERRFPGAHWDLYTDYPLHFLNFPRVRVRLIDESGTIIDSLTVESSRDDELTTQDRISVFIGHGRDQQWRDLKDHLQDQHHVNVTAYEIGARAGHSVKEVLEVMLRQSSFALLVLTGEDTGADGEAHARENVVHELGLFQGKLGFTRAIALLEEGLNEFSNIRGVNQIRFHKGRLRETFGDVVATINREFPGPSNSLLWHRSA